MNETNLPEGWDERENESGQQTLENWREDILVRYECHKLLRTSTEEQIVNSFKLLLDKVFKL